MKIEILTVLAATTIVIAPVFTREKRENSPSLVVMNIEALMTGEGTSPAIRFGYGSVVRPNDGSKVLYYW